MPCKKVDSSTSLVAYCIAEKIGLYALMDELKRSNKNIKMFLGSLHHEINPKQHVFYFDNGCIVFWGVANNSEIISWLLESPFIFSRNAEIEYEDMRYEYGENIQILQDVVTLTNDSNIIEKLAVSFAMSRSSKLNVYERRVNDSINETRHIPQELATTGSIRYSKADISKLMGRLFILRADVNLNSNLLDEPDFFWEFDEHEPLYSKTMRYLDVESRVEVLNNRLDVIRELLDVLGQELENQHFSKLEWIIIWLVLAEVLVQIFWNILIKDILRLFP